MSPTHQAAEPAESAWRAPAGPAATWLRSAVLLAAAVAGIVVVWALLTGAERDVSNSAALINAAAALSLS